MNSAGTLILLIHYLVKVQGTEVTPSSITVFSSQYICPHEGTFADYSKDPCVDYYQCVELADDWFYHLHTCDNGTVFDELLQSCSSQASCSLSSSSVSPGIETSTYFSEDRETNSPGAPSTAEVIIVTTVASENNATTTTTTTPKQTTTPTTSSTAKTITTPKPTTTTTTSKPTTTTKTSRPTTKITTPTTSKPTTTTTTSRPTTTTTTSRPTTTTTTSKPTMTTTTSRPTTTITTPKLTTTITTSKPTTTITTPKPTTTITTPKPTTTITTPKPTTTITTPKPTTTITTPNKPTTPKVEDEFRCTAEGYFSDPKNCGIYHACTPNWSSWVHNVMPCPAGLVYCEEGGYCGWKHDCPDIPCLQN